MPPHCDTMDGPVVKAAKAALEKGDAGPVLHWVPRKSETELKKVLEKALKARKLGKDSAEIADRWFLETVVRLHLAGEGASFSGIKPPGFDIGPIIPKAERALENGNPDELVEFFKLVASEELRERFNEVRSSKKYDDKDLYAAREHIRIRKDFLRFADRLYHLLIGDMEETNKR